MLPTPTHFQVLPPLRLSLVASNPHPHCSLCCLVSLAQWVIVTSVPEGCWCVFYTLTSESIKFTEVWHIKCFFTGTLIWYHTQINKHTDRHNTCIKNSLISKIYFPQCLLFSKLLTCKSHVAVDVDVIRLGSSCKTNNTEINCVNKLYLYTHTEHLKKITLERVS